MIRSTTFTRLPYAVQLTACAVVVAIVTKIGLMFSLVQINVPQIWSPAGLSIVILYFLGPRFLPAIFVGVLVNYLFLFVSTPVGILLAVGSTLEALLGSIILKRSKLNATLGTLRDVGKVILLGGVISTLFNAVFSVTASTLFNLDVREHYASTILLWWMGNMDGFIVVAPLLFVLIMRRFGTIEKRKVMEFFAMILIVFIGSQSVFHGRYFSTQLNYSFAFILFPFAIWGAIRFGMIGSAITTYIISLNATLSTQTGLGLFSAESYFVSIFLVDTFILVLGTTSLALAALIEERAAAEQAVRKSEETYRIITEQTGQLIYDYDVMTGTILWSGAIFEITQYTPQEFETVDIERWAEMIHPDDRTMAKHLLKESMRLHQEYNVEYRFRKKSGVYFDVLDRGEFLYQHQQDTTAFRMLGTMADVSRVNMTMGKLKENEERFRMLIEKSADGIILMDKRADIIFSSVSASSIIGYPLNELIGKNIFDLLHPSETKKYAFKFGRLVLESERSEYLLGRFKHKNGTWVYIEGMVTNLFANPSVNALVANFRDVTERIVSEDRLKRSLQEKEILLKEVHHRVKNNMQVISSLLNLQSASLRDKASLPMFRESQNRVKSMALVHEILYQSRDIVSVNFSVYVKQLVASLQKSFLTGTGTVSITVKVTNIVLDIDAAIPCGLIINELVSNALKYAFPKKRSGEIVIEVKKKNNAMIRLSVRDNGIGMLKQKTRTASLGLKLVHALADQLKGSVTISAQRGTAFIIEFPIKTPMAAAAV